jgi:multicomponent Na+:H+ antiporter subunit E
MMTGTDSGRGDPGLNAPGATPGTWQRYVLAFAGCMVLWLLLTGTLAGAEVIAGLVVACGVVLVSTPHLRLLDGVILSPGAPLSLVRYLGAFVVALVDANIDVARRVLSPALPIRPGVVEVRTDLESDLGRLILANSITLTPGTLSVDVEDDRILVHWIDCPPELDQEAATRAIAAHFERHLRGFLR